MTLAETIGNQLIDSLKTLKKNPCLSDVEFINEYRTVGAILPRMSGKSTFLKSIRKKESALLFRHSLHSRTSPYDVCFNDIASASRDYEILADSGLKFSCFLVDEYTRMTPEQSKEFDLFIGMLIRCNMLRESFFVLKMAT